MSEFLVTHEATIRFAFFAGSLAVWASVEGVLPARHGRQSRWTRWPTNLLLVTLGTLVLRYGFPLLAAGLAIWCANARAGLFHHVALPAWSTFVASLLALDLAVYAQHVVMHKMRLLWRLHRVHHSDRYVDATTGLRFHPGEIALSMLLKMAVVAALGAPAAAVIAFEVLLNATAIFNHANFSLSAGTERFMRAMLVTPDMHRIHHSLAREETDSNYGFSVSFWDRLFGTYRGAAGTRDFGLGLPDIETADTACQALLLPFREAISR